eukprot:m.276180 g.276180  ORF g.276180 m.276180 type:complete len:375 (+) comp16140_c0_seq2:5094-6218(+)
MAPLSRASLRRQTTASWESDRGSSTRHRTSALLRKPTLVWLFIRSPSVVSLDRVTSEAWSISKNLDWPKRVQIRTSNFEPRASSAGTPSPVTRNDASPGFDIWRKKRGVAWNSSGWLAASRAGSKFLSMSPLGGTSCSGISPAPLSSERIPSRSARSCAICGQGVGTTIRETARRTHLAGGDDDLAGGDLWAEEIGHFGAGLLRDSLAPYLGSLAQCPPPSHLVVDHEVGLILRNQVGFEVVQRHGSRHPVGAVKDLISRLVVLEAADLHEGQVGLALLAVKVAHHLGRLLEESGVGGGGVERLGPRGVVGAAHKGCELLQRKGPLVHRHRHDRHLVHGQQLEHRVPLPQDRRHLQHQRLGQLLRARPDGETGG